MHLKVTHISKSLRFVYGEGQWVIDIYVWSMNVCAYISIIGMKNTKKSHYQLLLLCISIDCSLYIPQFYVSNRNILIMNLYV